MAIFGKIDAATFSNNVAVTNGDATVTKNAADTVVVGDIIELSSVPYIVREVTSTTAIELHKAYAGSTDAALSGAVRRTAPKAVAEFVVKGGDSRSRDLVFVDDTEQAIAANKLVASGVLVGGSMSPIRPLQVTPATRLSASHSSMLPPPLLVTTLTILWWQMCLRQSRLAHNLLTKTPPLVLQPSLLLQLWINLALSLISGRRKHLVAHAMQMFLAQPVHLLC